MITRSNAGDNSSPVNQGQVIGRVGDTGSPSNNHLHFEVLTSTSTDSWTDPRPYLGTVQGGDNTPLATQTAPNFNPNPTIPNGRYRIRNVRSGLYLDAANYGATNGTRVWQWGWHVQPNQQWEVMRMASTGAYLLFPLHAVHMRLDTGLNSTVGTEPVLWFSGDPAPRNQRFIFEPAPGGTYTIRPLNAPNLALSAESPFGNESRITLTKC
jgi:hypothetical protein